MSIEPSCTVLLTFLHKPALHTDSRLLWAAPLFSQALTCVPEVSALTRPFYWKYVFQGTFKSFLTCLKHTAESHHPLCWKKSHITPLIWFLGYLNFLSSGLGCCSFFPLFICALLRMLLGSYFWPCWPILSHFTGFLSPSMSYLGFWSLFNTCVANLDYQVNFQPSSSAL